MATKQDGVSHPTVWCFLGRLTQRREEGSFAVSLVSKPYPRCGLCFLEEEGEPRGADRNSVSEMCIGLYFFGLVLHDIDDLPTSVGDGRLVSLSAICHGAPVQAKCMTIHQRFNQTLN